MGNLGGGGSTALSSLVPYQQNTHYALLGGGINPTYASTGPDLPDDTSVLPGGVIDFLDTALTAANPYTGTAAYDPTTDLAGIQTELDTYKASIAALNPLTDLTSYLAAALTHVDTLISSTHVDDEVDAFETKTDPAFARTVNRLTGPMFDNNAGNSSAFTIGMAVLERGRFTEIAEHRARLNTLKQQERMQLTPQIISELSNSLTRKLEGQRAVYGMQHELARNRIVANREFLAEELDLDYKELTHDLELFGYGQTALASGFGAAMRPNGPSKASTQLAATISTAATIATAASPLGMGPALALGAAGGLLTFLANG